MCICFLLDATMLTGSFMGSVKTSVSKSSTYLFLYKTNCIPLHHLYMCKPTFLIISAELWEQFLWINFFSLCWLSATAKYRLLKKITLTFFLFMCWSVFQSFWISVLDFRESKTKSYIYTAWYNLIFYSTSWNYPRGELRTFFSDFLKIVRCRLTPCFIFYISYKT